MAHRLNATAVPLGALQRLTLWPAGESMPGVSVLTAPGGVVTSNAAVVRTLNGSVSAYSSSAAHLVLDGNGYFAP